MRAVIVEEPGRVVVKDVPNPFPKSHEVLLRPRACGFCGTDVHILEGNFIGSYPVIPCHEVSGEVVQVGDDVEGLDVGDPVAIDPNIRCGKCPRCRDGEMNLCENYEAIGVTRPGGFAEHLCVPAKNVYRLKGRSFSSAAFAEPLACVLYGLSRIHFTPGVHVIVWGAGPIGLLHMLMCSRLHGAVVTVVDKSASRVERAKKLGAAEALVSDDSLQAQLRRRRPSGWDITIEATGSVSALEQMLKHLRRGGQGLVFGVYPRDERLSLPPFDVFLNDWSIHGSFTYRHEFATAVKILSSGVIDVESLIDLRIDLDQVPSVLGRLKEGEELGKVQVEM